MLPLTKEQKETKDIFVGRKYELELFEQLATQPDGPWLMLVTGEGGAGKTKLLNQLALRAQELGWQTAEIVDFYNLINQRKLGLLTTLRDRLGRTYFGPFTAAINYYDKLIAESEKGAQKSGDSETLPTKLAEAETRAIATFVNAYGKHAAQQQQILLFDTFEVVADTGLGAWFLFELLPQLQDNSLIVVAGRRMPDWQDKFQVGVDIQPVSLSPFDSGEVQRYLEEAGEDVPEPLVTQIINQSGGRPLLLALTVDWLREGYRPDELLVSPEDPDRYEKLLVERINELKKLEDQVIMSMAHVYHRFDADLLASIFSPQERGGQSPQEIINHLSRFSFVKYRPESGSCLLHDKMRDLVAKYVLDLDPTQMLRQDFSRRALTYYEDRLTEETNKPEPERNQREIDALILEQFYHRFYSDLENTYPDFWETLDQLWHSYRYDFLDALLQTADEVNRKWSTFDKPLDRMVKAARAWLFLETRRTDEAQKLAEEVVADPAGLRRLKATTLVSLGTALGYKGDYQKTEQYLAEALEIYDDLHAALEAGEALPQEKGIATLSGVRPERYTILNTLGFFARQRGRLDEAFDYYSRSLELSRKENDQAWIASAMANLAQIYRWRGDLQAAYDYVLKSLQLRQQLGQKGREAFSWNYLGMIYRDDGDYLKARRSFERAIALWDEVGAEWDKAKALRNLGWLNYREEQYKDSLKHYQDSLKIFRKHHMNNELPDLTYKMGRLYYRWGEVYDREDKTEEAHKAYQEARKLFEDGLELARRFDNQLFIANYLASLTRIAARENQPERIAEYVREVYTQEDQGYRFEVAYANLEFALGDWAESQGNLDEAFDHYGQAYAYLARHNEQRLKNRLGSLRTKLLNLDPEQQKRQTHRLIEFWQNKDNLATQFPYFIDMCQRLAM